MSTDLVLTIIGAVVVLIICGVCSSLTLKFYLEARKENKEVKALLKRSKENELISNKLI